MAKNRSAGKLHASCDTWRTPNKQGAWKILTYSLQYVCLSMLCVCVCIYMYILWVSPKHVFHPLLPFSPKLEFYKVILLTTGDHKNYLAVHEGCRPLKWKLVTSNTKECNRITINRNDSKRKGFFSTNLCVLRLLCESRFSACLGSLWKKRKHSKSWKNKTKLCAISKLLLVAFFLTSMKHKAVYFLWGSHGFQPNTFYSKSTLLKE